MADDAERERLRVERERERQDSRRLRPLQLTGVVILVVGIVALIAIALAVTGEGGSESTQSRPVSTGSAQAPVTLSVYEDYRCADCRRFAERYGETIDDLRRAGKLKVDYHPVSHVDETRGGHGSHDAAEAAMCAHDGNKFLPYRDVLYRNQPPVDQDAFGDKDRLVALARKVAGLSTVEFEKCVRDGLKSGRAERMQADFHDSGYGSPPVVVLDDQRIADDPDHPLTPRQLRSMVEEKAAD